MPVIYYLITCRNNQSPVGNFGGADCTSIGDVQRGEHRRGEGPNLLRKNMAP